MASVDTGGKGNKLNFELNLVPFIDLLSSLVLFLLLSAVWVQMGALPTTAESPGKSETTQTESSKLTVLLTGKNIQLTWPTGISLPTSIEKLEKLGQILSKAVAEKKVQSASVSGTDAVTYGQVIQAIDQLKNFGLTAVGLSTN
jgi:biopolymer transport protein TolR